MVSNCNVGTSLLTLEICDTVTLRRELPLGERGDDSQLTVYVTVTAKHHTNTKSSSFCTIQPTNRNRD